MCLFLDKGDLAKCDWNKSFPIITCGTGAGKTDFVMRRKLAECIEQDTGKSVDFILMLVPTQALRDDILSNGRYKATLLDESDLMQPIEDAGNIRVACFAKVVELLSSGNEITNIPDLIIIDEMDTLVAWSLYFDGYIEAWEWILSKRSEIFLCGLTATPSLLLDYVKPDTGISFIDITIDYPIKYKAKQIEIVRHSSASTYLKSIDCIDGNNKAIVYVRSARLCKALAKRCGNRAGFIISKNSEHYETQLVEDDSGTSFGKSREIDLREYLIEHNKLPPQMDYLFFNDCMNAGFNIEDDNVKTVIVDSIDLAITIQAKGRIRHDIEKLVVITSNKEKASFEAKRANAENECKANIFARAYYEYMTDVFKSADNASYYAPLVAHSESKLAFIDADLVAEKARNLSNFRKLDLSSMFGFVNDGDDERFITAKELKAISEQANIRNAKGNLLGKDTFVQFVNERSDFHIAAIGRKLIDGVRANYYKVQR